MEPAKKLTAFVEEFKNFALKGNVIDLAIGVIIGAAFGKIIESLVKNIIMPLVSLVLPGEQGYMGWKLQIGDKIIPYGLFIAEVVNFVIIALAHLHFHRQVSGLDRKNQAARGRQASANDQGPGHLYRNPRSA